MQSASPGSAPATHTAIQSRRAKLIEKANGAWRIGRRCAQCGRRIELLHVQYVCKASDKWRQLKMLQWLAENLSLLVSSESVRSYRHVNSWHFTSTDIEGVVYVLVHKSFHERSRRANTCSLAMDMARARWLRFRSYWRLAKLFREMRAERGREPLSVELFAYMQFPLSYNWRMPTENERYCMLRWAEGLDDCRPRKDIYLRAQWIADQATAATASGSCATRDSSAPSSSKFGSDSCISKGGGTLGASSTGSA